MGTSEASFKNKTKEMEEIFSDVEFIIEEHFINRTLIVQAERTKISKYDLIILRSFCKVKDTVTCTRRQPTEYEKIFSIISIYDRGTISKIYKVLKKLETIKSNNPI